MVLNDVLIEELCLISPYEPSLQSGNSYDCRWSGKYLAPRPEWVNMGEMEMLSIMMELERYPEKWEELKKTFWTDPIEKDFLILKPGDFVIMDTIEYFRFPSNICGQLLLKSSPARLGFNHALAGWFDAGHPGFHGTATLEVANWSKWPLMLRKGQPFVQMVFHECYPPAVGYDKKGNYNGQAEPQQAK